MEGRDCDEAPQWSEESLFKLSCKQLKKLARQSNLNSNFKKADLVKALLTTSGHAYSDITQQIQSKGRARVTRSRASVFEPLNESDNSTIQEFVPETYVQSSTITSDITDTITIKENRVKSKQRGKSLAQTNKQDGVTFKTSEIFKIVSSIQTNVQPLTEITNRDQFLSDELESSKSTGKKIKKLKENLKNDVKVSSIHEGTNTKYDHVLNCTFESECNNLEKEKLDVTGNVLSSAEKKGENKTRRGRKRKNVEENCDIVKKTKSAVVVGETNVSGSGLKEPTRSKYTIKVRRQKNVAKRLLGSCEKGVEDKSREENILDLFTAKKDVDETLDLKSSNLKTNSSTNENVRDKTPSGSSSTERKRKSESKNIVTPDLFSELNATFSLGSEEISSINADIDEDKTVLESEVMPSAVHNSTFVLKNDKNQSTMRNSLKGKHSDLLTRENTFTIDEVDKNQKSLKKSSKDNKFSLPKRRSTFTLEENDDKSPRRISLRFSPAPAVNKKNTPVELPRKVEKSIGKRILSVSMKQGTVKPLARQTSGSSVKKTITKNANTPGTAYRNKFGVSRKLPNFKSIHQKLFNNMESLNDNEKRKQERAQSLILSPIVPRCAFAFSSLKKEQQNDSKVSSSKKEMPARVRSPKLPSPAVAKVTTTAVITKPLAKTPSVNTKPLVGTKSVNRFGFRNIPKKLEAKKIVGNKMPPTTVEKTKDKERTMLQGVRVNKRFMLQMQMRQKMDC